MPHQKRGYYIRNADIRKDSGSAHVLNGQMGIAGKYESPEPQMPQISQLSFDVFLSWNLIRF